MSMKNRRRISVDKHNQESFFKLYKFLFEDERFKTLSDSAKIAYSLFRDRFNLSIQNNWVDEDGDIYFIYTTAAICEIIGCGTQKATKIKKELTNYGLLEQTRVGHNKANRIYILEPEFEKKGMEIPDAERNSDNQNTDMTKSKVGNSDNQNTGVVIIKNHELWKSKSNKTDSNKTDFNKTNNNLHNLYNLIQYNKPLYKQSSHASNTSHFTKQTEEKSKDQYQKNFSFNKYPKLISMELGKLSYEDAKMMMDITNKAKRAVSKEYDDMKNRPIDFSYETHEIEISQILNRMMLKTKFDNVSIEHLSRYISRSIQNYYRDYANEELQVMIEEDMADASLKFNL